MALVHDETLCGPLCQHPSCWASTARLSRGRPRRRPQSMQSDSSDEECGLPTQAVVNLLDDYGADPTDRYPSSQSGRPEHERPSISALKERHTTRASFPTVPPPHGSPASAPPKFTCPPPHAPPKLGKVEVQEVFDLEELKRGWQDTFMAKNYYVWVPNPHRKPREEIFDPLESVRDENQPPLLVHARDLTEDLLPREINHTHSSFLQAFWPMVIKRKMRNRSPPSRQLKTPKKRTNTPISGEQYIGVYDLLNLPKDELARVLDQFTESDRSALMTYLPTLEKRKKEAMLAQSQVLKQRKIELLSERQPSRPTPSGKQVFVMDAEMYRALSSANSQRTSPQKTRETQTTPRLLGNRHKTLPPVPRMCRDVDTPEGMTSHLPSVSLGLPKIPPGVRATQPFTYKRDGFSFTLGPRQTPPTSPCDSAGRPLLPGDPMSPQTSKLTITLPCPPDDDAKAGSQAASLDKISESGGAGQPASPTPSSTHVPAAPYSTPSQQRLDETAAPREDSQQALAPITEGATTEAAAGAGATTADDPMRQQNLSRRSVHFAASPDPPLNSPATPPPPAQPDIQPQKSALKLDDAVEETTAAPSDEAAAVSSIKAGEGTADEGSLAVEDGTEPPVALTGRSGGTAVTSSPPPQGPLSPEPWPKVTEEAPVESSSAGKVGERGVSATSSSPALCSGSATRLRGSQPGSRERLSAASLPRVGLHPSRESIRQTQSRESSLSDKAMRALQDGGPIDSPAPPPPSPEGKTRIQLANISEGDSEQTTGRGTDRAKQGSYPVSSSGGGGVGGQIEEVSTDGYAPSTVTEQQQQPIVIPSVDPQQEAALEDAEAELMKAVEQLDEFDNTDEIYKEELKVEYEKLSHDGTSTDDLN